MKKLVLVAALFMFVCGGSFVANAQDPVKTQQQQPATEKTEEPKATEPAKEEPKAEEPKAEEPKAEAPANGTPATETPDTPEARLSWRAARPDSGDRKSTRLNSSHIL